MSKSNRIISVDFLRGLTVALMILVNNPGSWEAIYPPFSHASWNGLTPTDLVFPFFLFIVGISIVYSLSNAKATLSANKSVFGKIAKRALTLFLLGLVLNFIPEFNFETLRIPGVLQRIALVFFFSATIFLTNTPKNIVRISISILVFYYILMNFIPVPNGMPANLAPTTNFGAWFDNLVLNGHLWAHAKVWDPEGIVSTMPAIVSGLVGVLTGLWLKKEMDVKEKLLKLSLMANVFILIALAWNMVFPINKSLWTSSFVLVTSGIAMHMLVISYWLIDVKKYTKGTSTFLAFGSNAITAYMMAELLARVLSLIKVSSNGTEVSLTGKLFRLISFDGIEPQLSSLFLAVMMVLVISIPIRIMYKKKIFIKV